MAGLHSYRHIACIYLLTNVLFPAAGRDISQALREEGKAGQYRVMSSGAVKKVQSSKLDGDLVLFAGENSTPALGIQHVLRGSESFLFLVV